MDFFDYEYRVIYRDTDRMGISYYANYLVWFEAARTEYFRALGLSYAECEKKGYFLPVVEASAKYHSPSTYDDLLVIRTSVSRMTKGLLEFEYQVTHRSTAKLIATGRTLHVFVDSTLRPCRIPEDIESQISIYKLHRGKSV